MEIYETIMNAIATIGFPATMCVLMFNYMKQNSTELTTAVATLTGVVNELKAMIQVLVSDRNNK